jgi:phosphate:Na+ symporter
MELFENIVLILAGCGAFLLGFKLLSDNMEKIAGNSLKVLFNKTSDKKWVGVGMGAVSTAVVQSSGVTTVMVVGFVNAGIMTLHQAAAVIMGANIGTTITAQLAALQALPIDSLFIALLFIGVMMEMFSKKDKIKSIGLALAGLGMVFFGLDVMSGTMKAYAQNQAVTSLLASLNNPFLLLAFGIAFTALVQSSSAVTTVIIAMASAGLIIGGGGNAVLYLILGSNIGSCVTALISSIGTSVNAKRASIIHLLFNVTGALLFMTMLLMWRDFFDVTFVRWFPEPSTQLAMFHTFFNLVCTLLFLPFTKVLVKLSTIIIKDKPQAEERDLGLVFMDKRFLATPAVAIGQLKKESFRMADMAMESLRVAFDGFIRRDLAVIDAVYDYNARVSKLGGQISDYLVRVSASGISLSNEKEVNALHNSIGDIERIAELADNLTKYTQREVRDNLVFSDGINEKLSEMHAMLHDQYALVKTTVLENKRDLIQTSDDLEEKIDEKRRELVAEHITRLSQGKCRPENNTIFINLVCNLERVGDHLNYLVHNDEN